MNTTLEKTETQITIPFPEIANPRLTLAVGACRLRVKPGIQANWVSGTYDDPTGTLPLHITQSGGMVKISQEINPAELFGYFGGPPVFDLTLGTGKAYALSIETGASECQLDLGGLPLTFLALKHGAGKVRVDFSAPNPEVLGFVDVSSGAGETELRNLGNANFSELRVEGGAAGYILDFAGELRRDGHVKLETGLASVELLVPEATPARIMAESVLGSVDVGNGFTKKDGAFLNSAALQGKTPALFIQANVALGAVELMMT